MTYPFATDGKLGTSFTGVFHPSTTNVPFTGGDLPNFPVGTFVTASDSSVWVRVLLGTGGCTLAGYVCTFNQAFLAVMMTSSVGAAGDKIGIYGASTSAVAGDYVWVQVYGVADQIQVAASAAANVPLASTATAGVLDDAVGGGTKNITGINLTTARAASQGVAPGELNWPVVGTTN